MINSGIGHGLRGLEQWHAFETLATSARYQQLMAREP
jgi:hypothetical protein